MPLAIIDGAHFIISVCLEDTVVLNPFLQDKVKEFATAKQSRFLYQILYNTTAAYQSCLRIINKKREAIEARFSKYTTHSDRI